MVNGKRVVSLLLHAMLAMGTTALFLIGNLSCSSSQHDRPLILVYSHKVDYEPLIIAKEKGFFGDEGAGIATRIVVGGIQAAEAIATGSADIAALGEAPAIILASKDPSVKIFGRYAQAANRHRIITHRDIETPRDLIGKRLGVQFGSSTHGAFIQWAQKNDLPLEAITVVPLNPLDMPSAMKTRQIDAMAGSEPWPTNVEEVCKDHVHQLADSGGLGNSFPMVLIARAEVIDYHRLRVQKVLEGIRESIAFINSHLEQSAELVSPFTGLSVENQRKCLQKFRWDVGFDETDRESLQMTADALQSFGKITHVPDLTNIVDLSLLEKH